MKQVTPLIESASSKQQSNNNQKDFKMRYMRPAHIRAYQIAYVNFGELRCTETIFFPNLSEALNYVKSRVLEINAAAFVFTCESAPNNYASRYVKANGRIMTTRPNCGPIKREVFPC